MDADHSFEPTHILSGAATERLESEAAVNGPLLPKLKTLEWTICAISEGVSQFGAFLTPTLKSFELSVIRSGSKNYDSFNLALRSDIKLNRLEVASEDTIYASDAFLDCLRCQRDLQILYVPCLKMGDAIDKELENLPNLRSLGLALDDDSEGDDSVTQ